MILVIDNYDSFVHNLARYITLAGENDVRVVRNDKITIEQIRKLNPNGIVLSPGPCTPDEAGICVDVVKECGKHTPILGVCLGHQAIAEAYGGKTVRSKNPTHGKHCEIMHNGEGILKGIPSPFRGGRYHSLVVEIPPDSPLEITARAEDGDIMAIRHKTFPVYGVQFHPESVLTQHGMDIIKNFVALTKSNRQQKAA